MGSPERTRSSVKGDTGDGLDLKSARARGEEEREGDERRKNRSSKLRKSGSGEDVEGLEGSGRKRSSGDKIENRKRSSGSSRAGSDEDDYESRKESRSKLMKKKQEESALESLSNWYQDGEAENRHDGGDRSGSKGHGRADESERRKSISKLSDHENSQSRNKGKDEKSHEGELERGHEKESRYLDRKESNREKVHGSSEHGRNQKKRWDDTDAATKVEESNYVEKSDPRTGTSSDSKRENTRERSLSAKNETGESKNRDVDLNDDKGVKSHDKEERRVFSGKRKSKGSAEAPEEDRDSPSTREDISIKERLEDNRQQRHSSGRENIDTYEKSFNVDEDGNALMREKSRREIERSNRSSTPERSARRHQEPEHVEMDQSSADRRKDLEKDGYRDERLKGRDDSWSDRSREREGSRDNWKRRQPNVSDRETRDGDALYEQGREWESQRRGRERADNERVLGRSGGRKDGNRTEAVKTSSNYGISNENYDVIEIQTKPFDYGREESRSTLGRKAEGSQLSGPNDDEHAYPRESRANNIDMHGSGQSVEDSKHMDDGAATRDQIPWRDDSDFQAGKGRGQRGVMSSRGAGGQTSSSSSQPPHGNQESGSSSRGVPQGAKGNRLGRGGRGRPTGRESQQLGIPVPMMGSPFAPLGMPPPGVLQPLTPSMSPGPGPPMSPGVFIPPFSPPVLWPGARALDMNMLGVPPNLSPVPPGPRFSPNLGTPPSSAMYFNQPGPGRGMPPNMTGPGFNNIMPAGRGQPQDKQTGGWVPPPRTNGPPGKAPSRGEQNDYSQNFVDTGMRPQNFIRELELTSVVEDYPKLRELIQKKDEIVANSATAPMYYKCDLREQVLSAEFFGTKFDVILVDPPWEEYVHRAPGVTDHMEYWTFEEIMNLKIEAIADTPSFIFLWVGDGVGLEQGRQCLKKWGFRRCEDICWVKTNKTNATPGSRHDAHTLFQRSKEHCLMGIKGTVRRSTDGHIIHANIDTDVIIAEEPPYGSTEKPEDMYRIVEHFSLGRRRLELFGEDHNIRSGWLTVGKGLTSSNFNAEAYVRNFADKDGKVWQGGGGRNPPPEAGHLVVTTPDIEALRPKSPMKNQQQLQHQHSNTISLTTANSSNKRQTGNSPTNHSGISMNQEASSSNMMVPVPWGDGYKGPGMGGGDDRNFDMYGGYNNAPFGQVPGDFMDFEAHRAMNLL